MAKRKTLYLIDGHSQIFRAYFARASFRNRSQALGAVFIFTRMLLRLLQRGKPDAIVCALDSAGTGGVRAELFPEYKANRDPMPEDLAEQMPNFVRVVKAFGIPAIEGGEYEADDVIGTLARQGEAEGYQVRIISRDKDLKQLLSEHVFLYDVDDGSLYGPSELEMDTGLKPAQIVDMLALMGDKVDNIPGVYGVGPVKAQALLKEYGTLNDVIAHADDIKQPKLRDGIKGFVDQAPISLELAKIVCDMPLGVTLEDAHVKPLEKDQLEPLLRELGFQSIIKDLGWGDGEADDAEFTPTAAAAEASEKPATKKKVSRKKSSADAGGPDLFSAPGESASSGSADAAGELRTDPNIGSYRTVRTKAELDEVVKTLSQVDCVSIDTETTGIEELRDKLVGVCLAWKIGEGVYIPMRAPEGEKILDEATVLGALKPLLEDPSLGKVGQNIKFDMLFLRNAGIELRGVVFDTQVGAYLANNNRQQASLDQLAQELLEYRCVPIEALIGADKKKQITMDRVPLDRITTYAAEDADIALRLVEPLQQEIDASGIGELSRDLEMPLVEVLADMEFQGIAIDIPYLKELSKDFEARIKDLEQQCYDAAGREFTINSPAQLATVLFDELGLETKGKTAKGARSTAVEVLEQLQSEHALPRLVLEYRHLSKLLSTYVVALPELADQNGRVHTSFRQAVATGRLASTNPNVQNIPVRTEEGRKIRRAFIAGGDDQRLVVADYSQIELRILAHLSGDPVLQRAFKEGRDIHRAVAAEVNGVPEDQVSSEMRSNAKAIHFGILYGQSAFGLSQALGISRGEASSFIKAYFERFPRVKEFIDDTHQRAITEGFVTTVLGRRRNISGLDDRNKARQQAALRQAFNTVVQGSAADLIKKAMLVIWRALNELRAKSGKQRRDWKLLIQVHDELVLEVPEQEVAEAREFIVHQMEGAMSFDVPIKADVGAGHNWLEAK